MSSGRAGSVADKHNTIEKKSQHSLSTIFFAGTDTSRKSLECHIVVAANIGQQEAFRQ